jgi:hypothetical protein
MILSSPSCTSRTIGGKARLFDSRTTRVLPSRSFLVDFTRFSAYGPPSSSSSSDSWATSKTRPRYDLIVTNDKLPDGSGRGLLTYVRDSDAGCRRVLTSTYFPVMLGGDISYERFFLVPNELDALVYWVDRIRKLAR